MSRILSIATRVSTPLSIAGLIVGFLFLIIKLVIAAGLIPQVTVAVGGTILLRVINGFMILAIVAIVLGFAGWVIGRRNPKLHPTYVSVVTDRVRTLAQVVEAVKIGQNVTINFGTDCDASIRNAKIEPGNHEGRDIPHLLENLKQRVQGESIKYSAKKEGERRYEIVCK